MLEFRLPSLTVLALINKTDLLSWKCVSKLGSNYTNIDWITAIKCPSFGSIPQILSPLKKILAETGEWICKLNSRHKHTLAFVWFLRPHWPLYRKNVLMDYQLNLFISYLCMCTSEHSNRRLICSQICSFINDILAYFTTLYTQ